MSKIKIISFDLYDTLISRVISPDKIYLIIGERLGIPNFDKLRIDAENKTSIETNRMFTIEDIYSNIELDSSIKEKALKLEIELEIKNTGVNEIGLDLYNKYKEKYKIICLSDMYLHTETLKTILKNNGYDIDDVYVSCDLGVSKRNKKAYKLISKTLNVKPHSICHIGDSIRSDYLNAKLSGFKTKFINKNNKHNYSKKLEKDKYCKYLGYKYFGPLFYEFCLWIHQNKLDNNLLFVSREGDIIYNFYKLLYGNTENIVYLSRKSVLGGITSKLIQDKKIDELFKVVSVKLNETVEEFINRIVVDRKYFDDNLLKLQLKDNTEKVRYSILSNKEAIIQDKAIFQEHFDKYITKYITTNSKLVDIGWNGSMQDLLNLYLDGYELNGLYLGCLNSMNKNGFLFNKKSDISKSIMNYSGLLELILMPKYGSTIGYNDDNTPIFDDVEFSNESLQTISYIQEGIIEFIKDIKKLTNISLFKTNELINQINKIGLRPNKVDLNYLGNIEFYDNGKSTKLINISGNLKKDFLETKWKAGFLKKVLKLNLNYSKILNKLRK